MKKQPILFVTGHIPPDRIQPFELLAQRENAEFALFGGRLHHAVPHSDKLPFAHSYHSQQAVYRLAASGRYRAVICGTAGRLALPAAYAGARRSKTPFILWSALWAHPRGIAGIAGWPALAHIYYHSDAIVTYGPHISAYVRAYGAKKVYIAPQAVDNEFWSQSIPPASDKVDFEVTYVGRLESQKGINILVGAWQELGLPISQARLTLVGEGSLRSQAAAIPGVRAVGAQSAPEVRNFLASTDVVVLPSIPTKHFLEPWGLAINEAMNQKVAVITTDAVGAAAGGLVRHGYNGLLTPAGDVKQLAKAIDRLHKNPPLRSQLGQTGANTVTAYNFDAWAEGFSKALMNCKPRLTGRLIA